VRFEGLAYSYKRAFSYCPTESDLKGAKSFRSDPVVLDPTAGDGSVAFEALRLGFDAISNDLNPVAVMVLSATAKYPLEDPERVLKEYIRLKDLLVQEREKRLIDLFPPEANSDCLVTNWVWARTISCPYCNGLIPLSPNWRLAPDGTGVRLKPIVAGGPGSDGRRCDFEIVDSTKHQSEGTVNKGDATCPFPDCGRVVDGDEVKRQAQAGKMGQQLYTVIYKERMPTTRKSGKPGKDKWVRGYRAPQATDDVAPCVRIHVV